MSDKEVSKYTRHQFNAYLGHYVSFWNYLGTYKNAFQALLDKVEESGNHVDHSSQTSLLPTNVNQ
jgi:hypothetical protein